MLDSLEPEIYALSEPPPQPVVKKLKISVNKLKGSKSKKTY